MLPFVQHAHEAVISPLLQTKLYFRRVRRRFLREKQKTPQRFVRDGDEKTRRRHFALLPARVPDKAPGGEHVVAVLLFLVALIVRGWDIPYPPSVVFDEVHFLRFVRGYYEGKYFFDIHPPLGKLILWLVTVLFCGKPQLKYDLNGEKFGTQIYTPLRWTSALFGSALAPITYFICRELGMSFPAALVPAVFYVFEHLAVIESRLVLMDAQLLFFMASCLLCALRLWAARKGTRVRMVYLIATALTGVCAIGVKWTALATPALVALVSLFGTPFPREGRLKWSEMAIAGLVAGVVYVMLFWIHFLSLPNSGQGDAFMPREFQRKLIGGKFSHEGGSRMGFVQSFTYLNREMYDANKRIKTRHTWESKWWQWIINKRGLLYFNELAEAKEHAGKMRKIYLIVNPAVSVLTLSSLIAFLAITFGVYLPKRRNGTLGKMSRLPGFVARGAFFFIGYVVNILPYLGK